MEAMSRVFSSAVSRTNRCVLILAIALMAVSPAGADLVINEVDYDQASTDSAEFVEILNTGLVAENLASYSLELVNGTGGGASIYDTIALPSVNLAPGDYFVVCANAATVANCDLDDGPDTNFIQNGAPDGVGLRMGAALVDALSYEGDTGAPYTEGSGAGLVDDSSVTDAGLSRCADGVDTDQNNLDFSFQTITPGAANDCPGTTLVINEVDYDQPGTDDGEFVEILNYGTASVDLGTITLELVNGSGGGAAVYDTIALPSVSLGAGDYFVVCANAATVANCDLDDGPDTNFVQNGAPDAVGLFEGAVLLDAVSYEGDTAAPYTEGSGSGLADPGTSGSDDLGISRFPDGVDTDSNNVDLSTRCITPGSANTAVDTDCGVPPTASLVINEIDYDQPGTDVAEFVEIKNTGAGGVDLGLYTLELINGNGGVSYGSFALPAVSLAAGDYFVVCADAVATSDCDLEVLSSIQNGSPDAVALFLGASLIDTVSYEGDTAAPYTEGSGSGLEDPGSGGAGGVNENKGISRFPDGGDTDVNNVDLSTRCITPGFTNAATSTDCPVPGPPSLVVNEIDYDQPGADTAEFVEIANVGGSPADLTGVDLLLVNGTGGGASVYQTVALSPVVLGSGDYFVVCSSAATVPGCDQEALSSIQNGAPDAVALAFGATVLDTVSYEGDTGAPYTEGSGSGLTDPGTTGEDNKGISRFPDGADTGVNNLDLTTSCITPGAANTSLTTGCSGTGGSAEIFEIQGSGLASPFLGQMVTTSDNVVTALAPDGFFMQTPDARDDADVDTSNGVFVFLDAAPGVAVGDSVDVTGTIVEFFDFTEIGGSPVVTPTGAGTMPAAVVFDATVPSPDPTLPSCAIDFECYEGMLISIAQGAVGRSNQSFGSDPLAEVHIVAGATRPYREPGVEFPGLNLPPIPTWDGNPEVFELDPDKLGLPNQVIPAGSTFAAEGVLGYEFGGYELWPTSLVVNAAVLPGAVRPRAGNEFTVGSLNMFRFFDDIDDPPSANANGEVIRNDAVVSTAEYMVRRDKFVVHILDVLDAPDILAVQEVEKIEVLQDLAGDISAVDPSVVYTAHLIEGNDIGTIDVGFLTRDTVTVDAVTQLGYTEILPFDGSLLNDRPPLQLDARTSPGNRPVSVIVVHNRSLSGIDSPTGGERVREKRLAQAQSLAQKVQDAQTLDPAVSMVVVGDFNAFEFTDGYVDVIGQISGNFDPAMNLLSGPDLVSPNLDNQVLSLPAGDRYSFVFRGNAQVLDHALTTVGLAPHVRGFEYGRGNADAAEEFIEDDTTNLHLRASDHDGFVLYLENAPLSVDAEGLDASFGLCKNITTRRLKWDFSLDDPFDCEALGLEVESGDEALIKLYGTATSDDMIGGTAGRLTPDLLICVNWSRWRVGYTALSEPSWNCDEHVEIDSGDRVTMYVFGTVD